MREIPPHVFEAIPMAALLVGNDFRIRAANSDFRALFSIDEEILSRPFYEVIPNDPFREMIEKVSKGGVGRRESRLRLNSGIDLRVVMKRASAVSMGGVLV